jgi:hypothetical protein
MCWEMDQAKKRLSNSQAFLDFWTLVANGIGLDGLGNGSR